MIDETDAAEQELCEMLRMKIAKAVPAELMPDFQAWVTLEQSLAYARGRKDEAEARDHPERLLFEPSAVAVAKDPTDASKVASEPFPSGHADGRE